MALELKTVHGLSYSVLERARIGESFRRWPIQTRFITPSFNSNPFGLADLNSIDANSSPAAFTGTEHMSGTQYADYLRNVAESAELPISCSIEVLEVHPNQPEGFKLITNEGEINTRFLIWACGEFQFPDLKPFSGGQWCLHYAQIKDWAALEAGHYTIIGGYESGVDAAFNLLKLGHPVRLLIRKRTWDLPEVSEPSLVLSPYTRERLREMEDNSALEVIFDANVVEVSKDAANEFQIHTADGRHWKSLIPPILGTGFLSGGGASLISDLWEWSEDGQITLSNIDESTITPGLFLIGPEVRHDQRIYCFIYKFRQRFAAIAHELNERLAQDPISDSESLESWGPFGNTECCEGCEC